ncbi:hypothetical protein E4U54_001655 [Claviceps lovelessii]|nr:hypothetical protein E4U54_001655 [Claviceps lovelessii]
MLCCSFLVALGVFCSLPFSAASVNPTREATLCSVFHQKAPNDCRPVKEFLHGVQNAVPVVADNSSVLDNIFNALAVLQNSYFDPVAGTWPGSIDWTGAVVETVISGTLGTLSKSLESLERDHDWHEKQQLISSLFAHVTHYFFGQNTAAIMNQAYDDVLWVVLGWLETIKFIRLHSTLHYAKREQNCLSVPTTLNPAIGTISWHGNHWICAFAHRARAFWDFATKGWTTALCGGGMVWNPRQEPYKNAITNELWISASASMYANFPEDKFNQSWAESNGLATNNPAYLTAAIAGYKWLKDINMTNSQGLFVDGFHIDKSKPGNVKCDKRDETVYTYNQGVILTGQRGLFIVTGSPSYLEEGHNLIQNVINATGWDLVKNLPIDNIKNPRQGQKLPAWRGLGRHGILEELCDAPAICSQDQQTFKGIFFHHLTAFCAPIDHAELERHAKIDIDQVTKVRIAHEQSCLAYLGWVKHNTDAALTTRDAAGRFGMWWGGSIFHQHAAGPASSSPSSIRMKSLKFHMTDHRNKGSPLEPIWSFHGTREPGMEISKARNREEELIRPDPSVRTGVVGVSGRQAVEEMLVGRAMDRRADDVNDRERGRTVETQVGGLALLRAYWEMSQLSRK